MLVEYLGWMLLKFEVQISISSGDYVQLLSDVVHRRLILTIELDRTSRLRLDGQRCQHQVDMARISLVLLWLSWYVLTVYAYNTFL